MDLFRDEQNIQNDGEVEGMSNNGVDSIPCEGGLVVKRTQVRARCVSVTSHILTRPRLLVLRTAQVVFRDPETKAETKLVSFVYLCILVFVPRSDNMYYFVAHNAIEEFRAFCM